MEGRRWIILSIYHHVTSSFTLRKSYHTSHSKLPFPHEPQKQLRRSVRVKSIILRLPGQPTLLGPRRTRLRLIVKLHLNLRPSRGVILAPQLRIQRLLDTILRPRVIEPLGDVLPVRALGVLHVLAGDVGRRGAAVGLGRVVPGGGAAVAGAVGGLVLGVLLAAAAAAGVAGEGTALAGGLGGEGLGGDVADGLGVGGGVLAGDDLGKSACDGSN